MKQLFQDRKYKPHKVYDLNPLMRKYLSSRNEPDVRDESKSLKQTTRSLSTFMNSID